MQHPSFRTLLQPVLAAVLATAAPPKIAGAAEWEFGGLAFGDAYSIASHHTEAGDGAAGVVLRRLYLTLDGTFSEHWHGRIRTETNQSGEFESYSFETDLKDLYLGADYGGHSFRAGLGPTPTFDLIESIWGLRYLARTPMDLQGIASRDTGVSAGGPLNGSGSLRYRAMVGSGIEFGNEAGDGNKWMGAISWQPDDYFTFDLYTDYERLAGNFDRSTWQVFAGYQDSSLRWGAQYSAQDRERDPTLELASAFVVRQVSDRTSLIARVDWIIEPSPAGDNIAYLPFDPSAPATMLIAGVEFRPGRHVTITPNIVSTWYDRSEDGSRPKRDLHLRLTAFLNFE